MEIIKGNRYVCIKDSINPEYYTKGNVYVSENDGCITCNKGDKNHRWPDFTGKSHFIPYSKLDRVYTKYTERLEKLFNVYEGKKKRATGGSIIFFDNCDADLNTDWFYASDAFEVYYTENNFTYLSESAFIEFMDLGKYVDNPKEQVFNPLPYYDNSNGSLYKVATERGWGAYLFDVVKRLERGGKKDPLRQEIEKSIDVLKIWLSEI